MDPGTEPSVGSSGSEEPGGQAAAQTEHFDHDDIPEHEDPSHPSWRLHEKHVFILSLAGKPIYSRYGNEDKLATIMGVMQVTWTPFSAYYPPFSCASGFARSTLENHTRLTGVLPGATALCRHWYPSSRTTKTSYGHWWQGSTGSCSSLRSARATKFEPSLRKISLFGTLISLKPCEMAQ